MERVGDYELLRELAEAGTGRLHLARRRGAEDEEPIVLKVLHERFRRNAFYTATLFSEASAARRFRHPVAVATLDVDDVEGKLFIAMERASGPSWRAVRERARAAGRRFSTDAVLWMGQQIAELLAAAARTPWSDGEADGLVVGQLAPRGLFLTKSGEVRVSGMGLGRSRSCLPPTRSRLPYRAPELFQREPVRPAADVYALGMVLYDALVGTESFQRESVAEVKAAVREEALPPLDTVEPEVDALLRAMTAKDPEERPDDAAEVARRLRSGRSRDGSLLSAEWAEHVRVLFPEIFEDDGPAQLQLRRSRRVSVPYSQTSPTGRRTPAGGTPAAGPRPARPAPAPTRAAPGADRPPAAAAESARPPASEPRRSDPLPPPRAPSTADIGPSTYDIEDLAEMLVGGTGNIATGSPATERSSPRTDRGASSALASLEDGSEFDVDSVVDAIFANAGRAAPRTPVRGDRATGAEPEAPRRADPYEVLEPAPRLEVESSDDLSLDSDDLAGDAIPVPRSLPSGDSGTLPPERRDDDGARRSNRGASPWSADLSPAPEEARAEALRPPVRSSANVGRAEPPTVPPDAEAPDEPQLHPGSVIQDRYRIIEELGRGGMSIVYRAEHTLLLKEVALKLLRPELSTLRNVVERFQREARSVCRLDDPNIVRVTDFGRTGEGLLYLVMELIQGESLASIIKSEGRLPVRAAIGLVDQILAGLEQAHRFEIVHRDLKPENIMLVSREGGRQVKILDFGIAKLGGGDEGQKSITQAGTVFGTPRYMSPEQAAGEPVDHRTDLYTVGVILYQLLTGAVPFHGDTTVQLLAKVLTQDPPPMEFEAPHEGARLQIEAVTMKALAKEPEDRFSSARAFREALDGCLLF